MRLYTVWLEHPDAHGDDGPEELPEVLVALRGGGDRGVGQVAEHVVVLLAGFLKQHLGKVQ